MARRESSTAGDIDELIQDIPIDSFGDDEQLSASGRTIILMAITRSALEPLVAR